MGQGAMILVFWMLRFKPTFSLSTFTFIKRVFSSSSLSAIRVVSSAYLRLFVFLLAILIPAFASSSLTFHMMYSAYKLNEQDDNIQPWCTPFPSMEPVLFSMSSSNCCFLTCKQNGRVIVESSDKMWSTGEENGKSVPYSCLENPMNSMKRKKDMTVKDELPRSVDA